MKKISVLFLSALFIFSFNSLIAGDDDDNSKIGGIRAGWQYSGIYENGNLPEGSAPMSSFYVGLYKELKLVPLLRLGGGVEYSQVGLISDNAQIDNSIKLHYVYIPIYLKVKLGPVYALGGASPSFKVGEKVIFLGEEITLENDDKANVFDVPLYLGLGFQIFFVGIEARYNWGMIDVYDNSKNQYLQVGATISF